MNTKTIEKSIDHNIVMNNRERISIEGVTDVTSFDEELVEVLTLCGALNVEGEGIHIDLLDTENGCLSLTGRISGLYYNDISKKRKAGLFGAREK